MGLASGLLKDKTTRSAGGGEEPTRATGADDEELVRRRGRGGPSSGEKEECRRFGPRGSAAGSVCRKRFFFFGLCLSRREERPREFAMQGLVPYNEVDMRKARKRNKLEGGRQESASDMDLDDDLGPSSSSCTKRLRAKKSDLLSVLANRELSTGSKDR